MSEKQNKEVRFSVALGLFDYINPIFYTITMITLYRNLSPNMESPEFAIFAAGALISVFFGLAIPTVKVIVGMGIMPFKMPVNLVSYVNSGILLSGTALSGHVLHIGAGTFCLILGAIAALLFFIYKKTGKFNTVAVLIGAAGYLMIYCSLISLALARGASVSVKLYALAICLFVFLCGLGIKGNLKDARVHWVIEICNVLCQGSVAAATVLLFKGIM